MKTIFGYIRKIYQLLVIVLIVLFSLHLIDSINSNSEAYCPFGGIQAITTYSVNNVLACDMTTVQIMMGIIIVLSVVVIGKIFCSYICPLGFINELLIKLRNYCGIKAINIVEGSVNDIILRSFKYILLFTIFYISTSSEELFCKKFDPYYALATGFNGELNIWLSLAAVCVLIFGCFFVNMFWCRYICPLGAINNIFRFFLTAIAIFIIYLALSFIGLKISWIILLLILCLAGYLNEVFCRQSKVFPILKIRRDENRCPDGCSECSKRCPYNIPIHKTKVIEHVDCTLCGDCVNICDNKALGISRKKWVKWLVPVLIPILFFIGIVISNKWEVPMVNLEWGGGDSLKLESTEVKGLRSVKCYASSMNFAKKAQDIHGVYGVKTFIRHYRVKLLYNPNETCIDSIKKAIFTPVKFKIFQPEKDVRQIKVITLHTENMSDPIDVNYLGMQLRSKKRKYYGLTSEYSNPLTLKLYIDIVEPVDIDYIRSVIEMKEMTIKMHGGETKKIKVDFNLIDVSPQIDTISRRIMLERLFRSYKIIFNEEVTDLNSSSVSNYDIVYPDIEKPLVARNLPFLSNYLSQTEGILGLVTLLNESTDPIIRIIYNNKIVSSKTIYKLLTRSEWEIRTKGNRKKIITPMFSFINKIQ